MCRSNNTDESESQTAGEVVRRCNLCNESDMALRKNRVSYILSEQNFLCSPYC